jgi:phage terminase large subunit
MKISIPYNWTLRDYQQPLWKALTIDGYQRAIYVWHRRAGKDLFGLNLIIWSAVQKIGTYWHIFPTYNQGKKAIWSESDITGRKYLDYIPKQLIKSINQQEMKIEFINGSVYQIVGSDNVDALRGAGIKGAVFSEYAEQRPTAWEVIQPMLMATNGWALFNFTPKGHNHAYELWEMAKENENWFGQLLTVDDTKEQVFTKKQIEQIKQEFEQRGKTLDLFNQEYYCSFNSAIEGSYYSQQMALAKEEGRITNLPYESNLLVDTFWDLGVNDTTAIWFTQQFGNEIRVIDYLEDSGKGLDYYIKEIKAKPYIYNTHNAPHDIRVREFTSGRSRYDIAYDLGISFYVVPNIPVADGINAVRAILNKCIFDKEKCKKGLLALTNYKKQFDELRNCFKDKPLHDWSSNGADAFRYLAVGIDEKRFIKSNQNHDYALT